MYNGNDRVKQINALQGLSSDLLEGYNVQSPADACETLGLWESRNPELVPTWYTEHERELAASWMATESLKAMLYQKATGYRRLIEIGKNIGVELVVLTPEDRVAYRLNSLSVDGPWEIGTVEDAAEYILDCQRDLD